MSDPRHANGGTGAAARRRPRVGIVGAGQLARMLCEAASELDIATVVLAAVADDAAAGVAGELLVGSPADPAAIRALAERVDVVTFDHELVDLDLLGSLERGGHPVRPGPGALEMAVDKAAQRVRLAAAGLAVPAFAVLGAPGAGGVDPGVVIGAIDSFGDEHGWPLVLKAARGGYDGRGVWPVADLEAADEVCRRAADDGVALVVEEHVALDAELAVLVARRPGGESVAWPAVETAQVDGVCREVLVPGRLAPDGPFGGVDAAAEELAREVAGVVGSVGVLAVELFLSGGRLLVNEVATRPHNSGHWTIEGATTSQFENHLRGVLDLPLGSTAPCAPQVASVNVFGAASGEAPGTGLAQALAVEGAHVHLYGKAPRPGRKLGHVTVLGSTGASVRERAWTAARLLGTPVPGAIDALLHDGVRP